MAADSIVSEVRQARNALAEQYNYDLHAIVCDARERQAASGRKVVAFPPKRIAGWPPLPSSATGVAQPEEV